MLQWVRKSLTGVYVCVYVDTYVTVGPQSPSHWEAAANSGGDCSADYKHIHIQHTCWVDIWDWSPSNTTPLASGMSCGDRTQAVFEHVGPADLRRIRTCSNKTNVAFRSPGAQRHLTNESMLKQMKEGLFTAALTQAQKHAKHMWN